MGSHCGEQYCQELSASSYSLRIGSLTSAVPVSQKRSLFQFLQRRRQITREIPFTIVISFAQAALSSAHKLLHLQRYRQYLTVPDCLPGVCF